MQQNDKNFPLTITNGKIEEFEILKEDEYFKEEMLEK